MRQAHEDLRWAEHSLQGGFFSQTCFVCQQVGEKALKAIALHRGASGFRTHSVIELAKDLGVNGDILKAGRILDQYYIPPRYPDALPQGTGADFFSMEQAAAAVSLAKQILKCAHDELEGV